MARLVPISIIGACAFLAVLPAGCRARGEAYPPVRPAPTTSPPPPDAERVSDAAPPGAGTGSIVGAAARLDFRPLGLVATDGFTLPLLSPDGRYIAVQTGVVPDEPTRLARAGQRPPLASRIALYRIEPRGLAPLGETEAGLVLGRSADAEGLLVESPRPDGSRWIGRIAWEGADPNQPIAPTWLVDDARVNAFATLGPAGTLAYSAREPGARRFDLVVRSGDGAIELDGDGIRSYLHPVFNPDGSRLFVLALRDGIAELTDLDPRSRQALDQSITRLIVTDRADERVVAQMMAPQGTRDAAIGADWLFFHPGLGSLVRWRGGTEVRPLPGGALAVGVLDAGRMAVLADGGVRMRGIEPVPGAPRERGVLLLDAVAVPRRIDPVDGAPTILLVAPEPSGVRLILVRALQD